MSEYWKSTPTYWCKHCSTYVRDTPVSKRQHESTPRHQGNIQRSLRTIHKTHEREERDKGRAKAEVERLNGIVSGSRKGGDASASKTSNAAGDANARPARVEQRSADPAERKRQVQQLAALGVAVPKEFRADLALAGDWETVATREVPQDRDTAGDVKSFGVRKRRLEDGEEDDEEDAKLDAKEHARRKPERDTRAWGSRMKTWKKSEDDGVDIASLMGGTPSKDTETIVKDEDDVKKEEDAADQPRVKREDSGSDVPAPAPAVDREDAPIVFKKRKNKTMKT